MIILVADLFQEDYAGGGELTTEAIMEGCFLPIIKVKTSEINRKILEAYRNSFWIFGNFAGLSDQTMMYISQNLNYSVIEYDYKFCSYRSPEKHIAASKSCNCQLSNHGKIVSIFICIQLTYNQTWITSYQGGPVPCRAVPCHGYTHFWFF